MNSLGSKITLNTTRICSSNIFQNAIEISGIVYADKSPNAIILANGDLYQDSFIATPLIHFPRNAPILFSHMDSIDQDTFAQIFKLKPKGINGIQVFIVGGISYTVDQLLMSYGLKTFRISGTNFYETSAKIARYLDYPKNIMIVSSEDYREGLPACAWAAHMGDVILFATKELLPTYTRNVINATKDAHVFIIGSTNTISEVVEQEIRRLNVKFVDRISGNTPYEVAVNFAKYKSPVGDFGWNRTEKEGHTFTFTSILSPFDSASGSLFAHLGKHTPILVVSRDRLPNVTKNYIESVKPEPKSEPHPPFMHGWVVGCENVISSKTQLEIEKALSIDEFHMGM
ncbi:MAG: cell wall-binding repeat-containing protein [Clostridia bacterium]|nr:cell wall-binding repeat-containing protein [Clostridia bacterium]